MKMAISGLLQVAIVLFCFPCLILAQTCKSTCGRVPIKYPFGTGPGCGDPRFQPYVFCSQDQQLLFKTHTGCYPVTSIDYSKQVMYISDPSMSTCACSQPSKGFSLDWNAPFSFQDDTIFALLDCSVDSSPIYKSGGGNNSSFPYCDGQGAAICSLLYSCQAVSRINLPVSTCCVYTPVDLGPSFEMDLQKLKCSSYSSIYGFNGQSSNPQGWNYGIGLKYKFNFNNDYPVMCANCEKSHGACGYNGPYSSFVCNCPNGINTTADCYFGPTWNHGFRANPWKIWTLSIFFLGWFFILAMM